MTEVTNTGLYYVAPPDDIFNEVKSAAMKLWIDIDPDENRYGYVTEKQNRIKDLENVKDNMMVIVSMFDTHNQGMLANMLTLPANEAIRERLIDGGQPLETIRF